MKVLALLLLAVITGLAFQDGYRLLKTIPFRAAEGGGEYFDYITFDASARRVYLSHGTEVKVVDADDYSVIGTITGLKRCHGVALAPEINRGFISDGDLAQVIVFDLKNLNVLGHIQADLGAC